MMDTYVFFWKMFHIVFSRTHFWSFWRSIFSNTFERVHYAVRIQTQQQFTVSFWYFSSRHQIFPIRNQFLRWSIDFLSHLFLVRKFLCDAMMHHRSTTIVDVHCGCVWVFHSVIAFVGVQPSFVCLHSLMSVTNIWVREMMIYFPAIR